MSHLRQDVSIRALNEQGGEYLPGYLGTRALAAPRQLAYLVSMRRGLYAGFGRSSGA